MRLRSVRRSVRFGLGAVFVLVLAACGSATPSGPASVPPTVAPSLDPAGPVSFTTADGVELAGRLGGAGPRALVLAPMEGSDMTAWTPLADVLAEQGYLVLQFDFRGTGASGGEGEDILADIAAAKDYVRSQGGTAIGLVGAGVGGTAALATAAKDPVVAGVVALSPFFKHGDVDAKLAMTDVTQPVLVIVGDGDVDENGGRFRDHAIEIGRAQPETYQILTMTGDGHGTGLWTDHGALVAENVLNFFARAFPGGR